MKTLYFIETIWSILGYIQMHYHLQNATYDKQFTLINITYSHEQHIAGNYKCGYRKCGF